MERARQWRQAAARGAGRQRRGRRRRGRPGKLLSLEEWCDRLFSLAAGWLGWPPDTILDTPFGQLELALEGRVDFVQMTAPFGPSKEYLEKKRLRDAPHNPGAAAMSLMAWATAKSGPKKKK